MQIITYEVQQKVRVRKFPTDNKRICELLHFHKREKKLSNKELASTLNLPVTKVEYWFRQDDCFALPEPEIWFTLKEILNIQTDEFDESIITFEEKDGVFEKGNRIYDEMGICPTITSVSADISVLIRNRSN